MLPTPSRLRVLSGLVLLVAANASAAEVSGRISMPDTCSPSVSPAVVVLEPLDGKKGAAASGSGRMALVRQAGLLFVPRVQVMALGDSLTFTNEDSETHSVHNVGTGNEINEAMRPGQRLEIVPKKAGVIKLVCDVHSHMRGYIVVSKSPWVSVCSPSGRFRLDDVPDGRYHLRVWHEMGDPLVKTVAIHGSQADLGDLTVTASTPVIPIATNAAAPPWSAVIDRIGVTMSASLAAAGKPDGARRARRLAEDAYWGEFEASDMETAVRRYLGLSRAFELEGRFLAIRNEVPKVAAGQVPPSQASAQLGTLLHELSLAADELSRRGIVDRSKIDASTPASMAAPGKPAGDHPALLKALDRALEPVLSLADAGEPDDAASALTQAYFQAFEPIERELLPADPLGMIVPRLESRFNRLRGQIGSGLKGPELAASLVSLRSETSEALGRLDRSPLGAFGTAFGVSALTILREGIEVILLLTMLFALVAKAGQPRYRTALFWGIGLAAAASLATAAGLNLLLASARGRSREILEGLVMLSAAGVLFYVSYWLISQSESKRWTEYLKRQVRHGAELGNAWTLGLTAFLAIYREGAETALFYQALWGSQASRSGQLGLFAGLALGLLGLCVVYFVFRLASVRLPLKTFFKLSGLLLFAMAVVFAGKAVFELQISGLVKVTPLPWLGQGLPALGVFPNVQAVSVQGMLLSGAVLGLVVLLLGDGSPAPTAGVGRTKSRPPTSAPV